LAKINYNFHQEEKLEQYFDSKLDGESNGSRPEAKKPYLDPKVAFIDPLEEK
jgi:hypothetical protein